MRAGSGSRDRPIRGELQKLLPDLVGYQARRRPWHRWTRLFGGGSMEAETQIILSPGYNSPVGWPKPFVFTLHDLNHLCVRDNSNVVKRAYYKHVIRPPVIERRSC